MNLIGITSRRPLPRPRRSWAGFTLIEAAITTCVIGLGVVGMLELIAAGTVANVDNADMTTAVNLARNVRERTLQQNFATVRGLNGTTFNPAVDSRGVAVAGITGWTQQVSVDVVDPNLLTATIVDATPDVVRVTARVRKNGAEVFGLTWYRFAPTP